MALIKCEECGKLISDKAQKCPQCGCPVTPRSTLVCPECGNMVTENDSKCTNCGCPSTLFRKANSDGQHANNNAFDNIVVKICPKCGHFEFDEDVSECSYCHTKSNLFKTCKVNDFLRDYAETFPDKELLYQANSGDADAAYNIGRCYQMANGVNVNWNTAFVWYKKAAYMGSVEGMKSLARLYARWRIHVPNAKDKALDWCEKAIKNGGENVYSQIGEELRGWHEYEKAIEWYKRALENHEANAAAQIEFCLQLKEEEESTFLTRIKKKLSPNDKKQKKRMRYALIISAVCLAFGIFKLVTTPFYGWYDNMDDVQNAIKRKYGEDSKEYKTYLYHLNNFHKITSTVGAERLSKSTEQQLVDFQNYFDSIGAGEKWINHIGNYVNRIHEYKSWEGKWVNSEFYDAIKHEWKPSTSERVSFTFDASTMRVLVNWMGMEYYRSWEVLPKNGGVFFKSANKTDGWVGQLRPDGSFYSKNINTGEIQEEPFRFKHIKE